MFGVCVFGLIVACVAEHFIKHKDYYKGTVKERIWLYVMRGAIAVLVILTVISTPSVFDDGACRPDPESQHPAGECN